MDIFTKAMGIAEKGVFAGGMLIVVFGLINLSQGIKDHNGGQTNNGIWSMIGGAGVLLASQLISQITL